MLDLRVKSLPIRMKEFSGELIYTVCRLKHKKIILSPISGAFLFH